MRLNFHAHFSQLTIIAIGALFLASCGTMRGIPTHGGGKRFDEEQRIVAASIRQAIADMNMEALRGRRVRIIFNTMSHSGGGQMQFPGIDSISLGNNHSTEDRTETRENYTGPAENPWDPNYRDLTDSIRDSVNANVRIRTQASYRPYWAPTSSDERYFQGSLHMFMAHRGIIIDNQKPEIYLHILVDVLGTNRSRSNYLLWSKDRLEASCELTYYAINLNGEIIVPAARSGARAQYSESSVLLVSGIGRKRQQSDMLESAMATPKASIQKE